MGGTSTTSALGVKRTAFNAPLRAGLRGHAQALSLSKGWPTRPRHASRPSKRAYGTPCPMVLAAVEGVAPSMPGNGLRITTSGCFGLRDAQTAPTERRHSTGSGHAALQRSGVWVERRGLRGPAKKCGSSRSHIHGLIHSASGIRHSAFPPYMAWRMNTTPTAWSPRRPPSSACGRDRRSGFPFARGFLNGRKTACPSGRTALRGH